MYADVVVLTYQAPDIDSFTYEIPKGLDVKIGQLVEVPFGNRRPTGIVVSKDERLKTNAKNIRPISKILLNRPILLPYQIELLKWMANYYLAPMVNCLEVMMPKIPKKSLGEKARPLRTDSPQLRPGLNLNHQAQKVKPWKTERSDLKFSQSIILIPSINRIPETLAKFPKAKNPVVYHNELKPAEKLNAWQKILSSDADYIFGSRSAVFAPCPNLSEIIIYDEHDGAYKDERSPYFDTLTVAQKIVELTRAELKIVDPCPKITTYFGLKNHIKMQNFPQETTVVDMQNEKQSGRKSPISFDLEEKIQNTIDEKGSIFLFLNKKKESGHMFCKSCKNSQFLQKQPETCPECASADIFWNVLNIDSLSAEVKRLFPKTKVNAISGVSRSSLNVSQITIGTAYSLYAQLLKKYDLVAHIQTDSVANLPDFNSQEKLYAQITSLKKLLTPGGKLFLQTYNVENRTIEAAATGNYQAFFESEIYQKKPLNYPPFGMLFKLTAKGKNKEKIQKEAQKFYAQLKSKLDENITTLGPYESVFMQKTPSYHIICKYKLKNFSLSEREKAAKHVRPLITLPKNWQVTVEPDSIN